MDGTAFRNFTPEIRHFAAGSGETAAATALPRHESTAFSAGEPDFRNRREDIKNIG
jgi:hypothetical protein